MERDRMVALVEPHLKAEGAGDVEGAVAVYTDDIEHDVVGWPGGPVRGKADARAFYEALTPNFRTEEEHPSRRYFAGDAMIIDQMMTGSVSARSVPIAPIETRTIQRPARIAGVR